MVCMGAKHRLAPPAPFRANHSVRYYKWKKLWEPNAKNGCLIRLTFRDSKAKTGFPV